MADDLRGDGLYDVHDALARLAQNTALLDRALQRFGRHPRNQMPPVTRFHYPRTCKTTTTQTSAFFNVD
ncbi:hypothetical protein SCUCBS95973_003257 [Sporothrix curviconia]|uniref:Uncharacterized protein n=1 Tax=Sporothrix curviconia TaxID=1260050 RepID=A0ABP0BE19_9PEZI